MSDAFSRTQALLGEQAMQKLAAARVAVFGIGGVGGYAAEALARSGIGALDLIDDDCISHSNINRQIFATTQTVGQTKVDAAAARLATIAPHMTVRTYRTFYLPQTAAQFDLSAYDYVIDAVDTVTAKIALAEGAAAVGTPLISAMGAGNKLDPTAFRVADISKTSVCPLARIMRKELKKRGIEHLKVVYSTEPPLSPAVLPSEPTVPCDTRPQQKSPKPIPGSVAFIPSVMGLILAGEVIKDLIKDD